MKKSFLYFGTAFLIGIAWYYALYSQWPYLFSHKIPIGGDAPDYYLGLYDKELLALMCITALISAAIFKRRIANTQSTDWVPLSGKLVAAGIAIFSWSIVIYAITLRLIGVNRPEQLNLFYPELFGPGSGISLVGRYLIFFLLAPIAGMWFSFLSFIIVIPMALATQWLMRKVAE